MDLSAEEKQRIYQEEKTRHEAQEKLKKETQAKKSQQGCLGCLGAVIVLFVFVGIVNSFSPGAGSSPSRQAKTISDRPVTLPAVEPGVKTTVKNVRPGNRRHHDNKAMTQDAVAAMFAAQGVSYTLENSPLADGRPRQMTKLPGGTAILELIGDPNNLQSVGVETLSPLQGGDAQRRLNIAYMALLLHNYTPRAGNWAAAQLTSLGKHQTGLDSRWRSRNRVVHLTAVPSVDMVAMGITIERRR